MGTPACWLRELECESSDERHFWRSRRWHSFKKWRYIREFFVALRRHPAVATRLTFPKFVTYWVNFRFAKWAIVPGPTHRATAPVAGVCFRSFTTSVGCSAPLTYSRALEPLT
jgi:hypothetical protein